jgi:hypothetical protein
MLRTKPRSWSLDEFLGFLDCEFVQRLLEIKKELGFLLILHDITRVGSCNIKAITAEIGITHTRA